MEYITDLHIHSHYSRATSKHSTLEGLYYWGKLKGINIIGTGDFTHPGWFTELYEKLEPAEDGLFMLKKDIARRIDERLPLSVRGHILRFILTVEISNIYSRGGAVRKLHNLIILPSFQSASALNGKLSQIGNIRSDGRPILGLDSEELLKITLGMDNSSLFIPAHIWTPWFAMFGSKSGFNSIEEAFGEHAKYIYAIETGLSSDPYMNWRVAELQSKTILSNSDAHSPQKLGREGTVLNLDNLSYSEIYGAIQTNDKRVKGTIEFFPEEGKYHYDGHRACGVQMPPLKSRELSGICPVCSKPLTLGVDYRVGELAACPEDYKHNSDKSVEYIIPLTEILSEMLKTGVASNKVQEWYMKVVAELGDEFSVLRNIEMKEITQHFPTLAPFIAKLRAKDVSIDPGYDGVYGKIRIFKDGEVPGITNQMSLEW